LLQYKNIKYKYFVKIKVVIECSYTSRVHGVVKLVESTYLIPTYV